MAARVAVVVFPGTNSEDETARALHAVGLAAEIVHWSKAARLPEYDAYVLPGGFAYEDRVRAGAVAAHDEAMGPIIAAAQAGKFVLGICNGAQILLESGLVPGTGPVRRPSAAFAPNAGGRFRSVHVHVKLALDAARLPILGGLERGSVIPAWASHGEGRLAAAPAELARIAADGHVAFTYCDAMGNDVIAHNGSALNAAALTNTAGTVLAIMPHPERDAWTFMHADGDPLRERARGNTQAMLAATGGMRFFAGFAAALGATVAR